MRTYITWCVPQSLLLENSWPTIIEEQEGVALLKTIHRLCNQQDDGATGLMEIVTLERSLALNVQGKLSKVD